MDSSLRHLTCPNFAAHVLHLRFAYGTPLQVNPPFLYYEFQIPNVCTGRGMGKGDDTDLTRVPSSLTGPNTP
jgi:hypothetical protein